MKLYEKVLLGTFLIVIAGLIGLGLVAQETPSPTLGSGSLYVPVYALSAQDGTSATTTLFNFPCVLHNITVETPVAGSVIQIFNSATTTGITGTGSTTITLPGTTTAPMVYNYDANFSNGVTVYQTGASSTLVATCQQQ